MSNPTPHDGPYNVFAASKNCALQSSTCHFCKIVPEDLEQRRLTILAAITALTAIIMISAWIVPTIESTARTIPIPGRSDYSKMAK